MLIIAGLGNPGTSYANNRHNIGFMAVDAIAQANGFGPWRNKFQSQISEGRLAGKKTLLLKPQTMMNLSGQAVGEAMRFYKIPPDQMSDSLIVIYDELDLAPGKVRFKTAGGAGGHNGIKSIIAHCGEHFVRMRMGIGHPGAREKVNGHVLGDFAKADQDWLGPQLQALGDHAALLATHDQSGLMNKLALVIKPVGKNLADPAKSKPKGQSHIRQARNNTKAKMPQQSPMAEMLAKLMGKKDQS